ncbi:MAG: BMP family ABC transporter substrate-binding protein [Firmicutes bacterium]|nr:BMP family ABC transporter substrate-binding protein [Bacillota bacterium]
MFGVIPLPKAKKTEKAPLKVLFIYAGPVSDGGWTQSHETIRQQIERSGGNVKADYAESVSSTEELKKVLSESKIKNYRVIVATSASFERETVQAAKKNPDKIFLQCSGRTLAPNLGTYFGKIYEARFLTGLIAGKMTKTNKIGFVGAYPVPEVLCGINAFALGVKKANPKANVYAAFTYSWFAPSQEREKAEQLIDAGCDLLTLHQDSPAVLQTAGEFGKNGIGYNSDMSIFAPGNHLTAPVWNWGVYYNRSFDEISDNTWKPGHYVGDLKDGLVGLAPFSKKVPAAVRKLAEDYEIKIKDGTINVFDGPVKDNKGKIRIKLGEKPDEKQIEKMDYLVEGVREIEKRK